MANKTSVESSVDQYMGRYVAGEIKSTEALDVRGN